MNNTVGQKIKNFRKRAGKSQFELELDIDASPGSISRIESGEVNPTKETLIKIIEALDIIGVEATSLFGVETNIAKLLKIPSELLNSNKLEEILSTAVNKIVYELNLLSGFVTLRKGNKLYAQITTERWFTNIVMDIISKPFGDLSVDLINDTNNICVQSYINKKMYYTEKIVEIAFPAVSVATCNLLQKVTGFKSGIVFPIIYNNECLGTFFVGKNFIDNFEVEIPILEEFTRYIGEAISKVKNLN